MVSMTYDDVVITFIRTGQAEHRVAAVEFDDVAVLTQKKRLLRQSRTIAGAAQFDQDPVHNLFRNDGCGAAGTAVG